MARFHVSQDETGFFQLTFENDEGQLALVSYHFEAPDQLIEDAVEMVESGVYGRATVVVDPARRVEELAATEALDVHRPAPRRAGEQ
jgi:hypothetical protein